MPQVRLKIHNLLAQSKEENSTGFVVISVSAREGEGALALFRRLAQENRNFNKMVAYVTGEDVNTPTITLLNGRFLSPHELSEVTLKEGDEATVLPLLDGG